MHVIAFLLSVVGIALSLCYSGTWESLVACGLDIAALKGFFGSLDQKTLCVVVSAGLSVLGALFALSRKRFGSLLLAAAAGVCLYSEFKLGIVYPYVRAAAGLLAAAAVIGWFRRRDEDDEEEDWNGIAAPVAAADEDEAEEQAAPAVHVAPVESAEPAAPAEAAEPAEAEEKSPCVSFWGLVLALACAAYSLYFSGLWETVVAHGTDLSWLKGYASFDVKTAVVLAVSALSVLGGVSAFFRCGLGGMLLLIAAILCGVVEYRVGPIYQWSWGAGVICLIVASVAWSGRRIDQTRGPRRYTGAYVYACIFGLAGVAVTLYYSGLGCALAAKGCSIDLAAELAALDCKGKTIAAIAGAGLLGSLLTLLGLRLGMWLLLAAMLGCAAGAVAWTPFFPWAWVAMSLFAVAAMLSGAYVSADEEKVIPVKKLTLHGAFLTAVFAAIAGGALMWYYNQSRLAETLSNARANDPVYQQLDAELKAREATIAGMNDKVREQMDFVAARDEKIVALTGQSLSKDSEIATLTKQGSDKDAQIADLNRQLESTKAELAEAQADMNRKFIYVRGNNNVRNVPNSDKGSKVIGRLTDTVVEMLDVTRPPNSSANWYQVRYGNGTGWVFGKNATVLNLKK